MKIHADGSLSFMNNYFQGYRKPFVMETVKADDKAKTGKLLVHVFCASCHLI